MTAAKRKPVSAGSANPSLISMHASLIFMRRRISLINRIKCLRNPLVRATARKGLTLLFFLFFFFFTFAFVCFLLPLISFPIKPKSHPTRTLDATLSLLLMLNTRSIGTVRRMMRKTNMPSIGPRIHTIIHFLSFFHHVFRLPCRSRHQFFP